MQVLLKMKISREKCVSLMMQCGGTQPSEGQQGWPTDGIHSKIRSARIYAVLLCLTVIILKCCSDKELMVKYFNSV